MPHAVSQVRLLFKKKKIMSSVIKIFLNAPFSLFLENILNFYAKLSDHNPRAQ